MLPGVEASRETPFRLSFEVHPGSGPFCMLVHGLLSNREHWTPNLAALAEVCRPVVVELHGHGRAPAPQSRNAYHPDAYVAAFEALRAELGTPEWLLIGQSLGAALTLRYALACPERVRAHVLTNSNSAFATQSWGNGIRPIMEALLRAAERDGHSALDDLPVHPRRSRSLPDGIKQALVAGAAQSDPRGVGLTAAETAPNSPLGERLENNRVPSLLVFGTRERRFHEQAERARAGMPYLEVCELDAGHAVNLEDPDGFNRAVVEFFERR